MLTRARIRIQQSTGVISTAITGTGSSGLSRAYRRASAPRLTANATIPANATAPVRHQRVITSPDPRSILASITDEAVGYFTLLALELVGGEGEVHAFEPVPTSSELLARNIEQTTIQNIFLNEIAVSSKTGTLTFSFRTWLSIPVGLRSFHLIAGTRSCGYLQLRSTITSTGLASVHQTSSRLTSRGRSPGL
jgi:hypothetical protein